MPDPKLSIGMPVYNASHFLPQALDSILSQTFEDFELVISDNASTDATEAICRAYAGRDARIRYSRNGKNMGAGWNFRRVYELARGRYYKQAAHDDFCAPTYFERAVEALDRDPRLTVAYAKTRIVNAQGAWVADYECPLRTDATDPVVRFRDLVLVLHSCYQNFGVHRMSALKQCPPQGSFAHADRILLAQLGLLGPFYEIPERLFTSTRHDGQSVWNMPKRIEGKGFRLTRKPGTLPDMSWWDPNKSKKIGFPEWYAFGQYCRSIRRSPLSEKEKARCYTVVGRWAAQYRRRMAGDLVRAADQGLWNWQNARAARALGKTQAAGQVEGGKTI